MGYFDLGGLLFLYVTRVIIKTLLVISETSHEPSVPK